MAVRNGGRAPSFCESLERSLDMGAVIALLLVLSTLTACAGSTVTDVKNAMPAMAAEMTSAFIL